MPFIINRDYDGFAHWQLAARENAALPPFRKFAVIRAESTTRGAANQLLIRLADELNQGQVKGQFKGQGQTPNERAIARNKPTRGQSEEEVWHDCEVLGPIPPLMERRNRWYRSQLLVSAARIRERQQVLISAQHWLQANAARSLRWHIDIDPSEQV
jgi:primosomal protein N'